MTTLAQTQARFFTAHAEYAVPAAAIRVPTHLDRSGLSELINKLLELQPLAYVSFDFLVEGVLLRSSLDKFLLDRGLSAENVLSIEYVVSLPEPRLAYSFTADDWIASVASAPLDGAFISCGFDGVLRLWRPSCLAAPGEPALLSVAEAKGAQLQVSTCPLKALAVIAPTKAAPQLRVLTGGLGRVVTLVCMASGDEAASTPTAVCEFGGHEASIEQIALLEGSETFATASFDSYINIYHLPARSDDTAPQPQPRKRSRGNKLPDRPLLKRHDQVARFVGHSGAVTALAAGTRNILYSGAQDCSVREWDVETASVLRTMAADTPVQSISFAPTRNLIASAHMKPILRLWDPRSAAIAATLATRHMAPIADIAWCPDSVSAHHLATASYDGSVRIFDTRNPAGPMHVLAPAESKVPAARRFCVAWKNGTLISGGDDCKLHIWNAM